MRGLRVSKHAQDRARTRLGVEPPADWWGQVANRCWKMPAERTTEGVTGHYSSCRYTVPCIDREGTSVDLVVVIDWAVPQVQTVWVRAVDGEPESDDWERAAEYVEAVWARAAVV